MIKLDLWSGFFIWETVESQEIPFANRNEIDLTHFYKRQEYWACSFLSNSLMFGLVDVNKSKQIFDWLTIL